MAALSRAWTLVEEELGHLQMRSVQEASVEVPGRRTASGIILTAPFSMSLVLWNLVFPITITNSHRILPQCKRAGHGRVINLSIKLMEHIQLHQWEYINSKRWQWLIQLVRIIIHFLFWQRTLFLNMVLIIHGIILSLYLWSHLFEWLRNGFYTDVLYLFLIDNGTDINRMALFAILFNIWLTPFFNHSISNAMFCSFFI